MTIFKTVPVPDRGIDYQVKPHAIDPRAWVSLDGYRTRNGTIRSFEGWNDLAGGGIGPGPIADDLTLEVAATLEVEDVESVPTLLVTASVSVEGSLSVGGGLVDDLHLEVGTSMTVEETESTNTIKLEVQASTTLESSLAATRAIQGGSVPAPTVVTLGTPILGLAEYFMPLNITRKHIVLTGTKAFSLNINTGLLGEVTGGATLRATPKNPWSIVVFGGEVIISSLDTDGLYKWDGLGTLTKIPGAPTFAFIATIQDYLMGFYERVGTDHYPYSLRWAAEASNDKWIADDTVDAGDFDIRDSPDKGVALYKLGDDLIAYKERTIVPITFVGGNEVFGRRAAVAGVGLLGPYALAAAGDRHIFMGQETFYSYTGGNVVDDSIGDSVRDLVYPDLNQEIKDQIRAIYLRDSMEIVWFYPSKGNSSGIGCDKAVIYNLKDGTWAGPMSITDYITFCANFTDPSRVRRDILGSKRGHVYGHGSSYTENGVPQLRVMESGDHNIQTDAVNESGGKLFWPLSMVFQVNVVNIDIESTPGAPPANLYVGGRLDLNDPIQWQGPFQLIGAAIQTIRVPVRVTGRWFRIRVESSSIHEFALQGYQFECEWVGGR